MEQMKIKKENIRNFLDKDGGRIATSILNAVENSIDDPNVSEDDLKQMISQNAIDYLKNRPLEKFDMLFEIISKMMKKLEISFPSKKKLLAMMPISQEPMTPQVPVTPQVPMTPQDPMVPQNPQTPMDPQDPNSIAAIKKRLIKLATKLDARNLHDLADELEFLI